MNIICLCMKRRRKVERPREKSSFRRRIWFKYRYVLCSWCFVAVFGVHFIHDDDMDGKSDKRKTHIKKNKKKSFTWLKFVYLRAIFCSRCSFSFFFFHLLYIYCLYVWDVCKFCIYMFGFWVNNNFS